VFYSRINRPTEQEELVNLNEIVSEFLLLRRKLVAEKKANVHCDQLPIIVSYKAPVTQLFHCLLDNALKYSRVNVPPVVAIKVEDKGAYWQFAIKDNGIGIENRFYEKVFIIFQRLHNRKEYDGTGIGLSTAKRAVEFLGGKIWLDSIVGEGSTFYFTISKTTNYSS
jgi:light-regulated signal transduction histidine kinase (bacteriophytochrome)